MKHFIKSAAALLLSGALAAGTLASLPVSVSAAESAVPVWIPQSFGQVIGFLNQYGYTHTDDYITVVRPVRSNSGWNYQYECSGLEAADLISDQTFTIKAEEPGEDDGSAEYQKKLYAYERYQEILERVGEAMINTVPEYQVLTFLPHKNGQISLHLHQERDGFVTAENPDGTETEMSVVETQSTDYSFEKTDDGCTQTDIYGWLPDSYSEFDSFVKANGAVSLHDQYVVVCTELPSSTGAELIFGQTGAAYTKSRKEQILYKRDTPGMVGGESDRSITLYSPKEEGRTVFTQYVGRLFDDSPAEITNTTVVAQKNGKKWTLSLEDAALCDLNADGLFTAGDLKLLSGFLLGKQELTDAQMVMADYNRDKRVNAVDLSQLKALLITDSSSKLTPESAFDIGGGWGGESAFGPAEPSAGDWGFAPSPSPAGPSTGEPQEWQIPQGAANVLTAGEWNDNENWDFFADLVQNGTISFPSFGLYPVNRVELKLTKDGQPLPNQTVKLTGGVAEWTAVTDRNGIAYLFYSKGDAGEELTIEADGNALVTFTAPEQEEDEQNGISVPTLSFEAELDADAAKYTETEIMFILDTTGSMSDEIVYLQKDFAAIAEDADNGHMTFSVNFYRDKGDDYVTRCNPFTDDVKEIGRLLNREYADGGGDLPEAVAQILEETLVDGDWHEGTNKIAFLIFDAPPHEGQEEYTQIKKAVKAAAEKGIHVVPVVASNADRDTELFGRALALMTNSNYVFLTDDSGVGLSHLEPIIGDYDLELLHDIIVRNILTVAGEEIPEKVIIERKKPDDELPEEDIPVSVDADE